MGDMDRTRAPHRAFELTSSAVGGALLAGAVAGAVAGPIAAAAGFIIGGVAGEVFDRRVDARNGVIRRQVDEEASASR